MAEDRGNNSVSWQGYRTGCHLWQLNPELGVSFSTPSPCLFKTHEVVCFRIQQVPTLSVACNLFLGHLLLGESVENSVLCSPRERTGNVLFCLRISGFHGDDGIVYGSSVPALALAAWMNKSKFGEQEENRNRKRQ